MRSRTPAGPLMRRAVCRARAAKPMLPWPPATRVVAIMGAARRPRLAGPFDRKKRMSARASVVVMFVLWPVAALAQTPELLSSPMTGSPGTMARTPSAYDPVRGRIVRVNDGQTWEWDGRGWFRSIASAPPVGLFGNIEMVFDPERRQLLLCTSSRLFTYDGTQWTELPVPQVTAQLPQFLHICIDTFRRRRVILAGDQATFAASTWEDSPAGWLRVVTVHAPSGRAPAVGHGDMMAFDPLTARIMLVTSGGPNNLARVFWYDGTDWTLDPSPPPAFLDGGAVAFDASRNVMVMHGGTMMMNGGADIPDVWEWNGTTWTNVPSTRSEPFSSLVFDAAHNRLLEVTGRAGRVPAVATWDGASWTVLDATARPGGTTPLTTPWRLVHDPLRNRTVAWTQRGSLPNETWEWLGTRWALGSTQQPPLETAFFDLARGAVVGIALAPGGVWAWNGSAWLPQQAPTALPTPRTSYALAFDQLRGCAVLFGGFDGNSASPAAVEPRQGT